MQKIYTPDFKTSPKNESNTEAGPRQDVLNNILSFSRSLEVLKPQVKATPHAKSVEIVLN